ncbi:hypothetical protein CMK11_00415 [Candidatus Poribacteria bacterium]|nr:hypothetical protein [Candidatus Poribacteria bacterium]
MRFRTACAIVGLALTMSVGASAQSLREIAVYHENVGWIGHAAADEAAAEIVANTAVTDISVVDMDGAAAWLVASTGDGGADVFFTFGYLPETAYEPGNAQADGSLIEDFIEDGNVALNTADHIFGGARTATRGLRPSPTASSTAGPTTTSRRRGRTARTTRPACPYSPRTAR